MCMEFDLGLGSYNQEQNGFIKLSENLYAAQFHSLGEEWAFVRAFP